MLKSHRFLIAATFAALASSMAGCHSSAPPVAYAPASTYAVPAAPVVVQSSGMGDMVAGAAIGSLAVKGSPIFPSCGNRKFPTPFMLRPLPDGQGQPLASPSDDTNYLGYST